MFTIRIILIENNELYITESQHICKKYRTARWQPKSNNLNKVIMPYTDTCFYILHPLLSITA